MTENEAVSLRDFLERRLTDLQAQIKLWADGHERVHALAERVLDNRLEKLNELRQVVSDSQATFVTKDEFVGAHERVVEDIRSLRESRAEIAGKASQSSVMWGYAFSAIATAISVLALFLRFVGK